MKQRFLLLKLIVVIMLFNTFNLFSQSEGGRVAFGFNYGFVKYWGEFTDNQFWMGGDLFFRYNLVSSLSLQATAGLANIRYKTDADVLRLYPDYFGLNAKQGDLYPGTTSTHIRDKNSIRVNTYELYLSLNLFPSESFVPFIFAGAGLMNFEPRSGDTGYEGPLPNNANGKYNKNQFIIPAGIGFEAYLTDDLVLNGRGTFRYTNTDWLDDYEIEGSQKDVFLTAGLGLSYYIFGVADWDKDGLSNSHERSIGTDPRNPDTDGDGLSDGDEVKIYKTNPLKVDTDGDGLTDFDEVMKYKTSPIKPDTDGDGLLDGEEIARRTDPLNPDTDGDGLLDGDEVHKYTTDPLNPDTDGDGLNDGEEVLRYNTNPKAKDTDADGLTDGDEIKIHKTNPNLADSDGDGINDGLEVNQYKTDPLNPDTDGDGLSDGDEVNIHGTNPLNPDSDNDGLSDGDEVRKYKTNPLLADTDRDGLNDYDEIMKYNTDPLIADTDKDGLNDGDEVLKYRTDPLKPDTDGDGLTDADEVLIHKTDPLNRDTDNDKLSDGDEVNRTKTDPLNPDTDGDGIIDGEDDCPLIAGEPSDIKGKNGCPQPPKVGTKTDFPDILFIVNTDRFNFDVPETAINLAKLLEYINQCEGLQVIIEGHASEEGNPKRNQELSELRAIKVRDWLLQQNVNPTKIAGTVGFGSSQPKVKEPTGAALKKISREELEKIRKQNRRITVRVTKTCD